MRAARLAVALVCLLAAGALLAACGEDSGSTGSGSGSAGDAESRPAPAAADFPQPFGRSLEEVLQMADGPAELIVSPAALVFYEGENRYPFGVFERDETEVADAEVALYFSRVPAVKPGASSKSGEEGAVARADRLALKQPAIGPFTAKIESLATEPEFRADPGAGPDPASVIYSAQLDFPSDGEWRVAALVREGEELGSTLLESAAVGEYKAVPKVGERAPKIHTPTAEDSGGELSKITTRVPPDSQNEVDYADVLGKEPIVLLFATPKFCQSRVCGPVVDVTEQAKQEYGDEAAFIHMEIYIDNDPDMITRPQVREFHLPTEPWLYTIDRGGTIRAAVEGAFGSELLDESINKALRE